jgi:hypothetical protein
MKKLQFLVVLATIGSINISSQTILQYSVHALKAGIDNPMSYCAYTDPGSGGKDQTWDFSLLKFEKPFTGFIKVSDYTNYQKAFPQSNTVLAEFNSLFYLKVTNNEIDQYGYISTDGRSKISYSLPFVKMKFPFAYGDIYSGSIIGIYEESGSISGDITGTYTVEADGYGKLILPDNTIFDDVLRVKTSKSYDNILATATQHVDLVTYRWYNSVHRYPILVLTKYKTSTGGEESINYQAAYNSDAIKLTNASEYSISDANLTLFPNPAISLLNMSLDLPVSENLNIEIYDVEGRQIKSFNLNYTKGTTNYNLSKEIDGLRPGSYVLKVNSGSSNVSKGFTLVK